MLKKYGHILVADYVSAEIQDWDSLNAQYLRIELPSSAENEIRMQQKSFYFADRTLKTSISLQKCPLDLNKFLRLPIEETSEYKEDILQIAQNSFAYDRRFHLAPLCSKEIASVVLQTYVQDLDKVLVALFKDKPIGFLALKEIDSETLFVHLAAVDEKYRMTGAAMALYAKACQLAMERGYKKLEGRISSQNVAVMNLYAAFGAVFSEPKDVFVKEVNHEVR